MLCLYCHVFLYYVFLLLEFTTTTSTTTTSSPIIFHFSSMATRRTRNLDVDDEIDVDPRLASPVLRSSPRRRIPRVVGVPVTPARKRNLVRRLKLSSSSEEDEDYFYFPSAALEGPQREESAARELHCELRTTKLGKLNLEDGDAPQGNDRSELDSLKHCCVSKEMN